MVIDAIMDLNDPNGASISEIATCIEVIYLYNLLEPKIIVFWLVIDVCLCRLTILCLQISESS